MKKLFALLLTVVMMASMMVPAMADYTVLTPADTTIKHSLTLTEADADRLPYDITYSFSVSAPVVMNAGGTGVTDASNAVTGSPAIADVTYSEEDFFNDTNKTCEKTLTVDWTPENADPVQIYEPGLYRWTVTQSYATDAPQAPSNASQTFYLFMYVTDNAGKLESTFILSKNENASSDKNGTLAETYPAKTVDLTISKKVNGNQASKDQYFPFKLTLTAPKSDKVNTETITYVIEATEGSTYTINVPATAYHGTATNPQEIDLAQGTSGEFTLWLKHDQSVTIKNMIYGTYYTITEEGNTGYTVTNEVSGDTDVAVQGGMTATDNSLTSDATVAYTNTKSATTPTGISLQSGAAFFGLVLAMGMMMLMFVGKRKEQN